jgi:hybrid cluster-associated redox disulfide protein
MLPAHADDSDTITPDMLLDEVMTHFPSTVQVFIARRMHCFGCPIARFETVAEACVIYRQPLQAMLADLNSAITGVRRSGSGARA